MLLFLSLYFFILSTKKFSTEQKNKTFPEKYYKDTKQRILWVLSWVNMLIPEEYYML